MQKKTVQSFRKPTALTGRTTPTDLSPYSHTPVFKDLSLRYGLLTPTPVTPRPRDLRIRRVSMEHPTPTKKRDLSGSRAKPMPKLVPASYAPYVKANKFVGSYKIMEKRVTNRSADNSPMQFMQRRGSAPVNLQNAPNANMKRIKEYGYCKERYRIIMRNMMMDEKCKVATTRKREDRMQVTAGVKLYCD